VLIYEGGFMRTQFPSGRVMATQGSDVETAIQMGCEATMFLWSSAARSCVPPHIEVHRRPATSDEKEWMRSIGLVPSSKAGTEE